MMDLIKEIENKNLNQDTLIKCSIERNEGTLGLGGSLMVTTGEHTGRSPMDKFFVQTPSIDDHIWWDNNNPMTPHDFASLKHDMVNFIQNKELFSQDLYACADPNHHLNIRVVTEYAWHSLFSRHLLRIPPKDELDDFVPNFTIINIPSFKASPKAHGCRSETVIAINMDEKLILIGGTEYAGEIKKSVFTLLNYILPQKSVMPMHCSANHAPDDSTQSALFFGLSGTGKTTLSADSSRLLIGDDEHGWSDEGIFNFEGGCYAKTINLDPAAEPEIYATTRQPGTIIENMIYNPDTLELDFKDTSLTANMRCAYPLEAIPNISKTSCAGHPNHIIMLTCDAYGVLPPVARLTPDQAIYHFLNGFTAKIAGTERGVKEPQPTFSTCFGAPFMPRRPQEYGELLKKKIQKHKPQCWLVNTGWTGGEYGVGQRISIDITRKIINSILDDSLQDSDYRKDSNFGFDVPIEINGIAPDILNPRLTWPNKQDYDKKARILVQMFLNNFENMGIYEEDQPVLCSAIQFR